MAIKYVVTHEFQDYQKGDQLDDADVAQVLTDNPSFVVAVVVPDEAPPPPPAPPESKSAAKKGA